MYRHLYVEFVACNTVTPKLQKGTAIRQLYVRIMYTHTQLNFVRNTSICIYNAVNHQHFSGIHQ